MFDEFVGAVHKRCDSEVLDAFVDMDLTLTQVRVVFTLATQGTDLSVGDLAEYLGLSLATAGRAVDRLVALDMVDRREDPDDRRSKRVSLTPRGRELADTQRAIMRDQVAEFSRALPPDVASALREAMIAALESIPEDRRAGTTCARNHVRSTS